MSKQKIALEVDAEVYAAFRGALDTNYVKAPMIIMCAMRSYAEGRLVQSGAYLIDPKVSREKQDGPGRPEGSFKKKEDAPPKDTVIHKKPYRKEDGTWVNWLDLDHSTFELKDFDVYENMSIGADGRDFLEIDWSRTADSGSLENMLINEYTAYRSKFTDRQWEVEYWNFCYLCACKFRTQNGMPALRYDQDHLQAHLLRIKDSCEGWYQTILEGQEAYDREHGVKNENPK